MAQQEPSRFAAQIRPMTKLEQQMDEDNDWALANYSALVEKYPCEYLVVWKKQVIAHGKDPEELLRQAATPDHPKEELVLVAFPDPAAEIPYH
jgi:hypothetical protein